LKGKISYISPEQALAMPVDHRSDVFSLGVVLFELFTGTRLYNRGNEVETYRQVVAQTPLPRALSRRPDLDPALDALIGRALERDPQRRIQSAFELQRELESWLRAHGGAGRAELATLMRTLFAERIAERRSMIESALNNKFSANDAAQLPALWSSGGSDKEGSGHQSPVSRKISSEIPYVI